MRAAVLALALALLVVAVVVASTASRGDGGIVCGPGTHVQLPPPSAYRLPRACVPNVP